MHFLPPWWCQLGTAASVGTADAPRVAGGWFLEPARHVRFRTRKTWGTLCRLRDWGLRKHRQCLTEVFIETIIGSHLVVRNDSERSQLSFVRLSLKSRFVTGQCHSRVLTLTQLPHPLPWGGPWQLWFGTVLIHARSYVDLNLVPWVSAWACSAESCDSCFVRRFRFSGNLQTPSVTAPFYIPFNDDILLPHGLAGIWHCLYGFLVPGEGPEGLAETRGVKVPGATNQTGPEERAAPARGDTGSESLICDDPHPHA